MSIKKRREVANISQVDLAKEIGVTQGMVSQWENKEFMQEQTNCYCWRKF